MSLTSDWKNWCCTCGNLMDFHGSSPPKICSFDKDLLEILYKFFETTSIQILQDDSILCVDCHGFLKDVVKFSQHCNKIQNMFLEIHLDLESFGECDVFSVRSRYDLDKINEPQVSGIKQQQQLDYQQCNEIIQHPIEVVKNETKVEDITNHYDDDDNDDGELEPIGTNGIIQNKNCSDSTDLTHLYKKKTKIKSKRKPKMKKDNGKTLRNSTDSLYDKAPYSDDHNTVTENTNGFAKGVTISKTVKKRRTYIKCHICGINFKDKLEYGIHTNANHSTFDYPFDCLKCPKRFSTAKGLSVHDRVHWILDGLKMDKDAFVCDHCGKSCNSYANLSVHLTVHSDEYPYECTKCPKKFKHLYLLRRHGKAVHSGIIHTCDICDQRFIKKESIRVHMVVHSEIKKYKCNYCAKEFKRTKALKIHLINHIGLKPYKCPFCDQSFTYGDSCRLHKRNVHPQELAELEASGKILPSTSLPKIEHLQCYNQNVLQKIK